MKPLFLFLTLHDLRLSGISQEMMPSVAQSHKKDCEMFPLMYYWYSKCNLFVLLVA